MKSIRADVLTNWNRKRNPGCRFYPGDKARLRYKAPYNSELANSYFEQVGTVIAVSSARPGYVRDAEKRRTYTKYYLNMGDGEIIGVLSGTLEKV